MEQGGGVCSLHQCGPLLWILWAASACGHQGPVSVRTTLSRETTGPKWEKQRRLPLWSNTSLQRSQTDLLAPKLLAVSTAQRSASIRTALEQRQQVQWPQHCWEGGLSVARLRYRITEHAHHSPHSTVLLSQAQGNPPGTRKAVGRN